LSGVLGTREGGVVRDEGERGLFEREVLEAAEGDEAFAAVGGLRDHVVIVSC
jgi:hypothetical protein